MGEFLTCQRVLSIICFMGFLFHHMIRVNISIAIVEMVSNETSNQSLGPHYDYNEQEKNNILGYFFWGYLVTQVPGGRLSEMFGSKIVAGIGLFVASLLTILTPLAAQMGYFWLISTRIAIGVALGVHWPSVPPLAARWIPPENMATFMSHMTASSLGTGLTLFTSGYLIAYCGWPSVFYVTGSIVLVWTILWFYFIYDTPEQHPRISRQEKEKLMAKVSLKMQTTRTPWVKIMTSGPVWAFIVANTCASFTFFLAFLQLPTYMSQVLHFNITQNGWFSSLPYLTRYFMSLSSSIAADKVKKTNKFSTTAIRKFFTGILFGGMTLVFCLQAVWGYNSIVTIVVFTSSLGFMGLATPGVYANCVDIAPNYSGTIYGLSQVPVALCGFLTTQILALATKNEQSFDQWRVVFWIVAGVNLFAGATFLIIASGEEQSWNSEVKEVEMERLHKNPTAETIKI